MTHTTLKVYIEAFTPEPGGMLRTTSTQNDGGELFRHSFPAGVIKQFDSLVHHEAKAIRIDVLTDYVERHGLAEKYEAQ